MIYKVFATSFFEKRLKGFSRKYRRIRDDYKELLDELEKAPYSGNRIQRCKGPVFKIRMASRESIDAAEINQILVEAGLHQ